MTEPTLQEQIEACEYVAKYLMTNSHPAGKRWKALRAAAATLRKVQEQEVRDRQMEQWAYGTTYDPND